MEEVKTSVEQKEKPKMNLLTNFDNTLQAMGEIEGYGWMLREIEEQEAFKKTGKTTQQSIAGAMEFLDNVRKRIEEETDAEEKKYLQESLPHHNYVVYGAGGWNRWFVDWQGNVYFSKYHAVQVNTEKVFQKVRAFGFGIM